MPKKIDVAVSSLVDLKAELFRKQGEFVRKKGDVGNSLNSTELYVKNKKPVFHGKQVEKVNKAERSDKIKVLEEAMLEEERQLRNSKQRLLEKAALYEKLSAGQTTNETDDDGNPLYLVNFEQKNSEKREKDDDDDDVCSDEAGPSYVLKKSEKTTENDEWVEFVDSFGRTRRCMRKDLPKFQQANDDAAKKTKTLPSQQERWSEASEMLSKDMKNEIERCNWEEFEESKVEQSKGPVHYQDVLRNEAWEHGVGYFQFSTDELERQKQMKLLDDMRQQTVDQRERNERVKEKRKQLMRNRLEKVKERKRLKLDAELSSSDEEEERSETNLTEIPLPDESQTKTGADVQSTSKKPPHVRPWDVGKPKISQTTWVNNKREERNAEFAPPSFY